MVSQEKIGPLSHEDIASFAKDYNFRFHPETKKFEYVGDSSSREDSELDMRIASLEDGRVLRDRHFPGENETFKTDFSEFFNGYADELKQMKQFTEDDIKTAGYLGAGRDALPRQKREYMSKIKSVSGKVRKALTSDKAKKIYATTAVGGLVALSVVCPLIGMAGLPFLKKDSDSDIADVVLSHNMAAEKVLQPAMTYTASGNVSQDALQPLGDNYISDSDLEANVRGAPRNNIILEEFASLEGYGRFYDMARYNDGDDRYVITGSVDGTVAVIDINNLRNPQLAGEFNETDEIYDLITIGKHVYFIGEMDGKAYLGDLDISNPNSPTLENKVELSQTPNIITRVGSNLFVGGADRTRNSIYDTDLNFKEETGKVYISNVVPSQLTYELTEGSNGGINIKIFDSQMNPVAATPKALDINAEGNWAVDFASDNDLKTFYFSFGESPLSKDEDSNIFILRRNGNNLEQIASIPRGGAVVPIEEGRILSVKMEDIYTAHHRIYVTDDLDNIFFARQGPSPNFVLTTENGYGIGGDLHDFEIYKIIYPKPVPSDDVQLKTMKTRDVNAHDLTDWLEQACQETILLPEAIDLNISFEVKDGSNVKLVLRQREAQRDLIYEPTDKGNGVYECDAKAAIPNIAIADVMQTGIGFAAQKAMEKQGPVDAYAYYTDEENNNLREALFRNVPTLPDQQERISQIPQTEFHMACDTKWEITDKETGKQMYLVDSVDGPHPVNRLKSFSFISDNGKHAFVPQDEDLEAKIICRETGGEVYYKIRQNGKVIKEGTINIKPGQEITVLGGESGNERGINPVYFAAVPIAAGAVAVPVIKARKKKKESQ